MVSDSDTEIGGIIGSNSHVDYVCEVYGDRTLEDPPEPEDYRFGQFVYLRKTFEGAEHAVVGVVYDTRIVDPDQGRTGPQLAQPEEQNIFTPGYVDEKRTLTGIALLGYAELRDGSLVDPAHQIPPWSFEVDDVVRKLPDDDLVDFHTVDGDLHLEYYQRMLDVAGSFGADVLSQVIDQLQSHRPDEREALAVIQRNLEWETKMEGGGR